MKNGNELMQFIQAVKSVGTARHLRDENMNMNIFHEMNSKYIVNV